MAEVIFHVGLPKTGTTYIQEMLAFNRDMLSSHNIRYHQIGTAKCACHWWFATNFFDKPEDYAPVKNAVNNEVSIEELRIRGLNSESSLAYEAMNYESVILSAEQFFFLPEKVLRKIKSFFFELGVTIKIVVYIRDFYELAVSELNQKVKMGMGSLDELQSDLPVFNVKRHLETYVSVFGKDAVNLKNFSELVERDVDIVDDFLSSFSSNTFELVKTKKFSNTSLSDKALRIIDNVNLHGFDAPAHSKVRDCLIESLALLDGGKFIPSKEAFQKLERKIEADLDFLNTTFDFNFESTSIPTQKRKKATHSVSEEDFSLVLANFLKKMKNL
ncbi:hypothetical protein [Alteromonas portus]|uniref:hypothetical protein n=1 Tax=Alteromonas portus TaxID=2565549 RepID=UPI003BF92050